MILLKYVNAMIKEAKWRNIKTDKNEINIINLYNKASFAWGNEEPSWMHNKSKLMRIVTTHKANLFKKDPLYYIKFQPAMIALKDNARPIGLDVSKGIDRVNFCHPFHGAARSSCSASCPIARSS